MFTSDLREGTTAKKKKTKEKKKKKKRTNKLPRFRLMPPRWPGMKAQLVATSPHGRFVVDSGFHSVSTDCTDQDAFERRSTGTVHPSIRPSIHPSIYPSIHWELWSSSCTQPKYTDPVKKLTMCCSPIVPELYCPRSSCSVGWSGFSFTLTRASAGPHFLNLTCSFLPKANI